MFQLRVWVNKWEDSYLPAYEAPTGMNFRRLLIRVGLGFWGPYNPATGQTNKWTGKESGIISQEVLHMLMSFLIP